MKKSMIERKTIYAFITICVIIAGILITFCTKNYNSISVFAKETEEIVETEEIKIIDDNMTKEFENIMISGGGRSSNAGIISGKDDSTLFFSDLTSVHYIPNANYFLINPWHHDNKTDLNPLGVCTTVSLQMLMGYHNYYSDRRIIPNSFLSSDYGDLAGHPAFSRSRTSGQGRQKIGTTDSFFHELFESMLWPGFPGLGQAIDLVKNTGIAFINEHTKQAARGNISLTSGLFSKSTAQSEINAGRPIVLGMHPFNNEASFHVVTAYGYAKLDGVDGFLVHWGWGEDRTQVWIPASWFVSQMRMSSTHEHSFIDGGNRNNAYRDLTCSVCEATSVDSLYNISSNTINSVKYPLSGSIYIPSAISVYSNATASFTNQSINIIGSSAFSNQSQLSQISIPSSIVEINSGAFQNCTKLQTITYISAPSLQIIGSSAFANCTSLTQISIPTSVTNIGDSAFNNCTGLTSITLSPSRIVYMGRYVFTGCNNLSITVQGASVGLKWKSDWDGNRPVTFTESGGCGIFHFTRYTATNVYYHTVSCKYCSDTLIESHTWVKYPAYYQCSDCQMTAVNIPIVIDNSTLLEYLLAEAEENDGYVCLHIDDGIELWYVDGQLFIVLEYERLCEIQAELNTITDWFYINIEQINSTLNNTIH